MNDRMIRWATICWVTGAAILPVCIGSLLVGPRNVAAQGASAPVTQDDVRALKLNHYYSGDRKSRKPDFEWSFRKTTFVIRKGSGKIPSDLVTKLLGEGDGVEEIRGKWEVTEGNGRQELLFSEIKSGGQAGQKEVRLPIYRTAPTVIRIGEPQYVFARDPVDPTDEEISDTRQVELRSEFLSAGMDWSESKHRIHSFSLVVEADAKGEGRGTLTLNPNRPVYDEFGDFITGRELEPVNVVGRENLGVLEFECRLEYLKSGAIGRVNEGAVTWQVYRLTGPRIKSKLAFATTGPGLTSGRLLVQDAKGRVQTVVELSETKPPDPEAPAIPCHPGCFPAGTRVRVAKGTVPIEDLRVGDEVLSIDAEGRGVLRRIEHLFRTKNKLFELRTEKGLLLTTRTQPVALARGGFAPVGELQPGERIWQWRDEERQAVVVKEIVPTDREEPVFNLVLGESAVFVAGEFLVRGKPPAEKDAQRKGRPRHPGHGDPFPPP